MTNMYLYIMFNDFLNSVDLKYGGNREVFINCSIRKYNDFKLPLFANLKEKRKGTLVMRAKKRQESIMHIKNYTTIKRNNLHY